MAHLGMQQTVHHLIIAQGPSTDAGPHREIEKCRQILGRSPASLSKRSSIGVGIEADRDAERSAYGPDDIHICPAWLGSRGDQAIVGGMRPECDGSERPNA